MGIRKGKKGKWMKFFGNFLLYFSPSPLLATSYHPPTTFLFPAFLFICLIICTPARSISRVSKAEPPSFRLADYLISTGKFQKAVDELRSLLQKKMSTREEQKATFLLGKSFLLNQQHSLASATFEYMMETWPENPYKIRMDFLEIDQELSSMTHMGSFQESAKKILNFPPFNLDPDFFRFFSGYTRGYFFSDYARIKPRLEPYLSSNDPDLKARAQLLAGLVESFDFQAPEDGLVYLKLVAGSSNQFLSHIASLALFIQQCSQNLENPAILRSLVPLNWKETRAGILTKTLYALVLAYIHGELNQARQILEEIQISESEIGAKIKEHLRVLRDLTDPSQNPKNVLKKARIYESYSSYHQALELYRSLANTSREPGLRARSLYEIGRILQDDFEDVDGAIGAFNRALKFNLPSEFEEEIRWRKIKGLDSKKRQERIHRYSHEELPFSEAAILEQMRTKEIDSRFLDRYFQGLLKLGLEPRSQMSVLKSLVSLAQDSNQFLKARFFLMNMARFDLELASKLMKETDLKEQIHQAELTALTSFDPQKLQFLQGRYLFELGQEKRAREILNSLSRARGLYSNKAKFLLFEKELGPLPYAEDAVSQLQKFFFKDPDPQIQKDAFKALQRHYQSRFRDYALLEKAERLELSKHQLPAYQRILQRGIESFPVRSENIRLDLYHLLLTLESFKSAKTHLDWFRTYSKPPLSLEVQFSWARANQDQSAPDLARELAKLTAGEPARTSHWIHTAFELERNHLHSIQASPAEMGKHLLQTLRSNKNAFEDHFVKEFLGLTQSNPEEPLLKEIFDQTRDLLVSKAGKQLFPFLEKLLKAYPGYLPAFLAKLEILGASGLSATNLAFLLEKSHHQNLEVRQAALVSLARASDPKILSKQFSGGSFLLDSIQRILNSPADLAREETRSLLNLAWHLSSEKKQRDLSLKWQHAPAIQSEFFADKLLKSLLAKNRLKEGLNILDKSLSSAMNEDSCFGLFQTLFSFLDDTSQIDKLKPWLFKIRSNKLNAENAVALRQMARKINARAVLSALSKNVNWDDPQSPKNIENFFQMVDVAWKELGDIPRAADLLAQMRQYFSNPKILGRIQKLETKLPMLQNAHRLEKELSATSLEKAGKIWLEDLKNPSKALELFERAAALGSKMPAQTFLSLQRARALIRLQRFPEAQEILNTLPQTHSSFSLPLLRRIEGAQALNSLPDPGRSNLNQLLNRAQILLVQLRDFAGFESVSKKLLRELKTSGGEKELKQKFGRLLIEAYRTAMGHNDHQSALSSLKRALESTLPPLIQSRAFYLLGTHYSTYEPRLKLAQTYFKKGSKVRRSGSFRLLNLLGLVQVLQETGHSSKALAQLRKIKKILKEGQSDADLNLLEEREVEISRGLVFSKIDSYLSELDHPDPSIILSSARALRRRPEYHQESERKFLLYLRLENEPQARAAVRRELALLYVQNSRLSEAVEQYDKVLDEPVSREIHFEVSLQAARVMGMEIRNYQGALKRIKAIKRGMLDPEQVQSLKKLEKEVRDLSSKQRRLKLSTLSFNHFPAIREIKNSFYKARNYREAAKRLEKLYKQSEDFPLQTGIHYELGRLYDLKLSDYKKALEHYAEFLDKFDHDEISPEILLRIAEIHLEELKSPARALRSYRRYLEQYPFARKRLAVLFQVGELLINHERDYSSALDTYADISRAYPQTEWDEKAKFAKANLLSRYLSDFLGAIEAYEDLVERNFQSDLAPEAQFRVGKIYEIQLNDKLRAIDSYQKVIDRFPGSGFSTQARDQLEKIRRR